MLIRERPEGINAADLPLPPATISCEHHVKETWADILQSWARGYNLETELNRLEAYIEFQRCEIFENKNLEGRFNWEKDWLLANSYHSVQVDFVSNRRHHIESVVEYWREWDRRNHAHFSSVILEALKSMVIINGAAIIASLAILSGQIENPRTEATIAAKLTVTTSVISLVMMASGHALLLDRVSVLSDTVRGALVGRPRHTKLFSISRYIRRYLSKVGDYANYLIYGSVILFGISALVSAIILIS